MENILKERAIMTMTEKVEIIVPTTIDVDIDAGKNVILEKVEETLKFMSRTFGGATAVKAKGGYVSDNGTLVKEKVTKVYSFAEQITENELVKVLAYCDQLKQELSQECIGLEINGAFYLI